MEGGGRYGEMKRRNKGRSKERYGEERRQTLRKGEKGREGKGKRGRA